jgi:hypothetical protein
VQVNVLGRVDQHPVAVPPRFPQDQVVAVAFEGGHVAGLVFGLREQQVDVDDRLAARPGTDVEPTCSMPRA